MNFVLDRFIAATVALERTPMRIIMTSDGLTALIEETVAFDDLRCHGQTESVHVVYMLHHPGPLVPVQGGQFLREITPSIVRAMREEARHLGVSHYRGIRITINDGQTGVVVESRPWAEVA